MFCWTLLAFLKTKRLGVYKKSDTLSSSISRDVSYLRPLLSVLSTLQSHFCGDSDGGIGIQVSLFGRVGQTMSTILLPAPLGGVHAVGSGPGFCAER